MKIRVVMGNPYVLLEAIENTVEKQTLAEFEGKLSIEETKAVNKIRVDKIKNIAQQWFTHNEYLIVEIDTDANTCIVLNT